LQHHQRLLLLHVAWKDWQILPGAQQQVQKPRSNTGSQTCCNKLLLLLPLLPLLQFQQRQQAMWVRQMSLSGQVQQQQQQQALIVQHHWCQWLMLEVAAAAAQQYATVKAAASSNR
jgi:hypothetical protein